MITDFLLLGALRLRVAGGALESAALPGRRFLFSSLRLPCSDIFAAEPADRSTVATSSAELISWNLLSYYVLSRAVGQPDSDSARYKYTVQV